MIEQSTGRRDVVVVGGGAAGRTAVPGVWADRAVARLAAAGAGR